MMKKEISYQMTFCTKKSDKPERITRRTDQLKVARAEAERQRARLEGLFMQSPTSICVLDGPELVFELINPALEKMFPGRNLLGKTLLEAFPEIIDQPIRTILRNVYQTGETFYGREVMVSLARHKGELPEDIYFNAIYQARYNEHHQVDGIRVFIYEVTAQVLARQQAEQSERILALSEELAELEASNKELRANNEELSAVNQKLMKANAELDTFVYTASHDLRSPVFSLDALLVFLSEQLAGKLDSEEQELLSMIQTSSNRLQRTIGDLTQIVQAHHDTQEEKTIIHFPELLVEVQADLANQIEASGAQLHTAFRVESLPYVRRHIRSILYNLLSNALKYHSPERLPEIVISTRMQAGKTILTLADNGLGLPDTQQQGLFTMFRRFHTHVDGSGVGLYIIKRIIENNGGQITVESQLNQGTTFQVQF